MQARELLKSSVFDKVRSPSLEKTSEHKLVLDFDSEDTFDYETVSPIEPHDLHSLKKNLKDFLHNI